MRKSKRMPVFGLIVAVASAALVIAVYAHLMTKYSSAAGFWPKLGDFVEMGVVRPFLIVSVLSVICAFIGYFTGNKWVYLVGCALMVFGIIKLPKMIVARILVTPVIVLLLAAFLVIHFKHKASR